MKDSALIVFLPLVGAVLGAIVGALANGWYRDREAKKAEDREREGLLRLIDLEVQYNKLQLHIGIKGEARLFDLLSINKPSTDIWDRSAVRLTQLLTPIEASALAVYYKEIAKILNAIEASATPRHEAIVSTLSKAGSVAVEQGDKVIELLRIRYFEGKQPPQIPMPPSISARDLRKATDQP